jgi:hypothetical protein
MNLPTFEIVVELGRPVAALIKDIEPFDPRQIKFVYGILPVFSFNDSELARRWEFDLVACEPAWAKEQLRRVPMTRPRDNLIKITIE